MADALMKKEADEQRQLSAKRCCFQSRKTADSTVVCCGFPHCLNNTKLFELSVEA